MYLLAVQKQMKRQYQINNLYICRLKDNIVK